LEERILENFNISENNIISVKLAKVLGYWTCCEGGQKKMGEEEGEEEENGVGG
jgi:hypothetical protein